MVPDFLRSLGVHTQQDFLDFLFGFELATFLGSKIFVASVFTGAGQYLVGALAERWTGRELEVLGPSWRLFHGVPFDYGFGPKTPEIDVDHIAIEPYGVLVVETKYLSIILDLNDVKFPARIRDAISQVEANAQRVRGLLNRDFPGIPVRPVVIVWGRLITPPNSGVRNAHGQFDDIRIVHGADGDKWRSLLEVSQGLGVQPETVERVSAKIESYMLNHNEKPPPLDALTV